MSIQTLILRIYQLANSSQSSRQLQFNANETSVVKYYSAGLQLIIFTRFRFLNAKANPEANSKIFGTCISFSNFYARTI